MRSGSGALATIALRTGNKSFEALEISIAVDQRVRFAMAMRSDCRNLLRLTRRERVSRQVDIDVSAGSPSLLMLPM